MTVRDLGLVAIGVVLGTFAGMSVMIGMALDYEHTEKIFRALRARYGQQLERKPTP